MSQPDASEQWSEIVRLKDEMSLASLSARFGYTPGELAAALKRTGALAVRRPGADDLPPEPGDDGALPLPPPVRSSRVRPGSKDEALASRIEMLGKVPDAEVAREAGVSVRTVASYRARHGIAGYRGPRRRGRARSAEAPEVRRPLPVAAPDQSQRAWAVRAVVDGTVTSGVVLAGSLDAALEVARARLGGEIVAVELSGPVLGQR